MTNSTPNPADALIAALHEPGRENLLDLVRNPLRLTLLCMTWDGSSLPETQAELYERYLRKIYEWNRNLHELEKYAERCGTTTTKLKQDSHQQSDILKKLKQNLNRKLGELAKAALNLPQERFRLSQALVEQHLGEESDKTSLAYLALRLGWLNRVGKDGRGDSIFAFYHATFQEYFAALAVEDWDYFLPKDHCDRPVEGKRYRIFEKQWKQVILCWLGRGDIEDEEKEGFIRALVEFDDGCGEWNYGDYRKVQKGFYEFVAYFLAGAGTSEFKHDLLSNQIIGQLVRFGFGDFHKNKQEVSRFIAPIEQTSKSILKETETNKAINVLVKLLSNTTNNDICIEASRNLLDIQPENQLSINALLDVLDSNKHTPEECLEISELLANTAPKSKAVIRSILDSLFKIPVREQYNKKKVKDKKSKIESKNIYAEAATSLEKIFANKEEYIDVLIDVSLEILRNPQSNQNHQQIAKMLVEFGISNSTVSSNLVEMLGNTQEPSTCMLLKEILEKIAQEKITYVIQPLVHLLDKIQNKIIKTELELFLIKISSESEAERDFFLKIIVAMQAQETLDEGQNKCSATEIDITNEIDILTLAKKLTETSYIFQKEVETLKSKAIGHQEVINLLLKKFSDLLDSKNMTNNDHLNNISMILCKISKENEVAIDKLLEYMEQNKSDYVYKKIVFILNKIVPSRENSRREKVISALIKIINNSKDRFIRVEVIHNIGKIALGHQEAILALIRLLDDSKDRFIRVEVIHNIGKIALGHQEAILALIRTINDSKDASIGVEAIQSLGKIGVKNEIAINGLVEFLKKTEDENNENTILQAAENLNKISPENPAAINSLVNLLKKTPNAEIRKRVGEILGKIGIGDTTVIHTLSDLVDTTQNEYTRWQMAIILGNIGQGNRRAIASLLKLIKTTEDNFIHDDAPESLLKILTTPQQYTEVVSALKNNLSDEVYQNDFKRFDRCYKVLWKCAENLSYPEFYQAWHNAPTTPHPEVEDNTPVASTPFTQQCNLALLPQILNQAIQTHPLNCQPICIDGSRFSDPSNPALQIYTTLKKAGCPVSPDGKPDTISKLQAYCEDDLSDRQIALILYEEPTDPPPQGFDIAVLNQLARFSHPPIAVVVPQPLPECRLPQFLESDPDLMATLLQWLQNLDR